MMGIPLSFSLRNIMKMVGLLLLFLLRNVTNIARIPLSYEENAYVRPSPTRGVLGGVALNTGEV